MKNNKVFFPNLDGLRFIAALMVLMPHIEQIKSILNLEYSFKYYPAEFGKLGVVLFFVLSGYLITYLLLVEQDIYKTISIKKFYLRRIFRIWPLYYLLVVLSLFVFPHIDFLDMGNDDTTVSKKNIILYLLFLPNLAFGVPFISQTWSVGVEEQFYLIWPVLMKYIKNKYFLFVFIFFAYFIILFVINQLSDYPKMDSLYNIFKWFKIDCMAIGGLFALLLFDKKKIISILYSKTIQITTYIIIILLLASKIIIPHIHFEIFAVLFGIVILNLSSNEKTIITIKGRIVNYLGKISYGIYMYHPLAIVVVIKLLIFFDIDNILLQYSLSIILTIFISYLSYIFFEKYFIQMKRRFSRVISGEDAKI